MGASISQVEATATGLRVTVQGAAARTLSWRWIRDHGEDEASFDAATKQRRVYAIDGAEPAAAIEASLATVQDQDVVQLTWSEPPETTWISCETLVELITPRPVRARTAWDTPTKVAITKLAVADVLASDVALRSWLDDIDAYGVGVLTDFAGGHDEVAALAGRIGYPRSSIFGTTWDLASDIDHHDDTAYTQSFLAPHTDGTYCHDAPGLQIFCCIERSGAGGESIVVDGLAIAETLRTEHAEHFDLLTQVNVPAHYIEPGVELRASRPPLRLDEHGDLLQLSMNNYDRSPLLLPAEEMDAFYVAYGRLHELANDPGRWLSIRLEAGDVLINDNWRVLHGRHEYRGARRFVGCYLNHEDFESRLRTCPAG